MRSLLIEIGRRNATSTPEEAGSRVVASRWVRVFWLRGSLAQRIAQWSLALKLARDDARKRDQ